MLIGEILAKVAIKKTFGIDIARQKFAYTEYGKPYLMNFPNVHFNISHSGAYVACAVSDKPIGVDIQKIGEYNYDIAKRVCNEKELKQIEESRDKAAEFTKIWVKKESVLKRSGEGLTQKRLTDCLCDHCISKKTETTRINDYFLTVCQ